MLKGIPPILQPELLKIMMEMGHGDTLVIGDGNFPAASVARRLIRCDGNGTVPVLDAVLKFFPLDSYSDYQAGLMQVVPGDSYTPEIWAAYREILERHEPAHHNIELIERFEFYNRAQAAYAVVSTSETALYANIILKKGVVSDW